jgi:hypothetical protein
LHDFARKAIWQTKSAVTQVCAMEGDGGGENRRPGLHALLQRMYVVHGHTPYHFRKCAEVHENKEDGAFCMQIFSAKCAQLKEKKRDRLANV